MRKARTERDEELRDTELRTEYNFEHQSPFDVPPGVYREGYRTHWARHNIRGGTDHRIEKLQRKGWELIPASRSTTKYIDPLGENPLSEKFIYVQGYLLMERLEKYCEDEERQNYKEMIEQTRALDARVSDEGHAFGSSSRRY